PHGCVRSVVTCSRRKPPAIAATAAAPVAPAGRSRPRRRGRASRCRWSFVRDTELLALLLPLHAGGGREGVLLILRREERPRPNPPLQAGEGAKHRNEKAGLRRLFVSTRIARPAYASSWIFA